MLETMGTLPATELSALPSPLTINLGSFVRKQFDKARDARTTYEVQMLEDKRQMQSQYSNAKLQAIKMVMGPNMDPPYIGITESKCDAIYAYLIDYLLPPGKTPFDLEHTPVPELPKEIMAELEKKVQDRLLARLDEMWQAGEVVNGATLKAAYDELMARAKKQLDKEVLEEARRSAIKLYTEIKDQFAEGGWEDAFRQSLHDLILGTAIMRGPVLRNVPKRLRSLDPVTRKFVTTYANDIIPQWDRLVPERFYPAPEATRQSLPWYVYVNSTSRKDLAALLKDSSYDQAAVKLALEQFVEGHREVQSIESEKARLEGRTDQDNMSLIDRLEYGGSVPGSYLKSWATDGSMDYLDSYQEYEAQIYQVGPHVLKAVLNPDPVGLNYIFSAGFTERPDSFWGIGVPRKMRHTQNIANIAARATVMNIGIASGPLTEINVDRMWPGENYTVTPWKVIKSTNSMMQDGKAVNFYQPNMVAKQLIEVFQWAEDVADRETGIPRILYSGESRTPTATATSQLASAAAKGAMAVVRNVDAGLIIPAVQAQVNYTLQYESDQVEYFGDVKVIARGSTSQVAAETKVVRLKELLAESSVNPVDAAIFTKDVRLEIWKQAVEALGLDPALLGEEDEIEAQAAQIEAEGQQAMQQEQEAEASGQQAKLEMDREKMNIDMQAKQQQMEMQRESHAMQMQQKQESFQMQTQQKQAANTMQLQQKKQNFKQQQALKVKTPRPKSKALNTSGQAQGGRDVNKNVSQKGSKP